MIRRSIKFLFLGLIASLSACDSTGICTEQGTASFMVAFSAYDNLNNENIISPPKGTLIFGLKDGKNVDAFELVNSSDKDSTKFYPLYPNVVTANSDKFIPLLFDENRDETEYIYLFQEGENYLADTIKVSYKREQLFVSPECGYKTIFHEVVLDNYSNNKIDSVALLSDFIEYDNEQHLKIYLKE